MPEDVEVDQETIDWIIGHPKKLEILRHLHENGPTSPSDLADAFDVNLQTMSEHLSLLRRGKQLTRLDDEYQTRSYTQHQSVVKELTGRQSNRIYDLNDVGEQVLRDVNEKLGYEAE